MFQAELPIGGDAPNARTTDPISSHIANASIRANKTMADWVIQAIVRLSNNEPDESPRPVDDNEIWEYIEEHSGKRQQRNNIARCRGLLERDGFFIRIPGDKVQVVPSNELLTKMGIK